MIPKIPLVRTSAADIAFGRRLAISRSTTQAPRRMGRLGGSFAVHPQPTSSSPKAKRWRSPNRPDAAVMCPTKGEAIAFFKRLLGVPKLPSDFVIETF